MSLPRPRVRLTSAAFTSVAMVGGHELGRGSGSSKKASEQRAARQALEALRRVASRRSSHEGEADVPEGAADAGLQVVSRQRRAAASTTASPSSSAPTASASRTSPTPSSGRWPSQSPVQLRAPTGPGRALRRVGRPPAGRGVRGRARARQRVRHAAARVRRGVGHAPARPRRRERVPGEPGPRAPPRRARAAVRHRPRPRDALGDRPGQGRGDPALEAARAAPVRRGGRRARQVPAPPRPGRVEAGARRAPSSSGPATSSAR